MDHRPTTVGSPLDVRVTPLVHPWLVQFGEVWHRSTSEPGLIYAKNDSSLARIDYGPWLTLPLVAGLDPTNPPLSGFTGTSVYVSTNDRHLLIHGWPARTKQASRGGTVIPSTAGRSGGVRQRAGAAGPGCTWGCTSPAGYRRGTPTTDHPPTTDLPVVHRSTTGHIRPTCH